jgi:hypothetical protein
MLHCKERLVYKFFVSFLVDASQHQFLHLEGIGKNVRRLFFEINVMNWKLSLHWVRVCPMQLQTNDFVISFQNDLFVLQVILFYHSKYGCHTLFCVGEKVQSCTFDITSIEHNVISICIGDLPMFSPIDNNKKCAQKNY